MKVTFLGVGSAFSRKYGNSNILIESGDMKLLIDCSRYCPPAIEEYGLSINDITHIFITHLHADHIGGLEEMALMTKFVYKRKITLLSTDSLLKRLWEKSLSGALEFIENKPGELTPQTLHDFFIPETVDPLVWNPVNHSAVHLYLRPTSHVRGMESYSVEVQEEPGGKEKRAFFSGDTKFDPNLIAVGIQSGMYTFHDCQLFDTGPGNSLGVHASYHELVEKLPREQRERLWLYHYGDTARPDAKQDGFQGFVTKFQSFTI